MLNKHSYHCRVLYMVVKKFKKQRILAIWAQWLLLHSPSNFSLLGGLIRTQFYRPAACQLALQSREQARLCINNP